MNTQKYKGATGVQDKTCCSLYFNQSPTLKILSRIESKVFFHLIQLLEWDTNFVFANPYNKKAIADGCGIKVVSVKVALSGLVKKNLIQRVRNNLYIVNPTLVWFGTKEYREKLTADKARWLIEIKKIK